MSLRLNYLKRHNDVIMKTGHTRNYMLVGHIQHHFLFFFFLSNYTVDYFWRKKQKLSHTPHRKVNFATFLHNKKK